MYAGPLVALLVSRVQPLRQPHLATDPTTVLNDPTDLPGTFAARVCPHLPQFIAVICVPPPNLQKVPSTRAESGVERTASPSLVANDFQLPSRIAIDSSGRVYVSNFGGNSIDVVY
jgi:hypothetical protein